MGWRGFERLPRTQPRFNRPKPTLLRSPYFVAEVEPERPRFCSCHRRPPRSEPRITRKTLVSTRLQLRLETAPRSRQSAGFPFNKFGCRSASGIPEARSGRRISVAAIRTSDCARVSKNVLAHSVQPFFRFRIADLSLTNRAAAL